MVQQWKKSRIGSRVTWTVAYKVTKTFCFEADLVGPVNLILFHCQMFNKKSHIN